MKCPNCGLASVASAYFHLHSITRSHTICLECGAFMDKNGVWYRPVKKQDATHRIFEPMPKWWETCPRCGSVEVVLVNESADSHMPRQVCPDCGYPDFVKDKQ